MNSQFIRTYDGRIINVAQIVYLKAQEYADSNGPSFWVVEAGIAGPAGRVRLSNEPLGEDEAILLAESIWVKLTSGISVDLRSDELFAKTDAAVQRAQDKHSVAIAEKLRRLQQERSE